MLRDAAALPVIILCLVFGFVAGSYNSSHQALPPAAIRTIDEFRGTRIFTDGNLTVWIKGKALLAIAVRETDQWNDESRTMLSRLPAQLIREANCDSARENHYPTLSIGFMEGKVTNECNR